MVFGALQETEMSLRKIADKLKSEEQKLQMASEDMDDDDDDMDGELKIRDEAMQTKSLETRKLKTKLCRQNLWKEGN